MAKQGYQISTEIKDEIIKKIKHEGLSVMDAAKQYGISDKTIYNWLGTKARGTVSILEHNKIKKENEQLKQIIGDQTLKSPFLASMDILIVRSPMICFNCSFSFFTLLCSRILTVPRALVPSQL